METIVRQETNKYQTKKSLFKTYQVIWYLIYLIEVLVALRVVFRVLGANAASPIVAFTYALSQIFVFPFVNIFPSPMSSRYVLDAPAIIALVLYPIGAYMLVHLLQLAKPVSPEEVNAIEKTDIPEV